MISDRINLILAPTGLTGTGHCGILFIHLNIVRLVTPNKAATSFTVISSLSFIFHLDKKNRPQGKKKEEKENILEAGNSESVNQFPCDINILSRISLIHTFYHIVTPLIY